MSGLAGRALVLASRSPRRAALLREAGYLVLVDPSDAREDWPDSLAPGQAVVELALAKARHVASRRGDDIVMGADTEVMLDGSPLGKPASRVDAARMLTRLSGREHEVWSGVAVVWRSREYSGAEQARVWFRTLTERVIDTYLDSAVYLDKAGAYGIQEDGAALVKHREGRLDTIVGLPMNVVERLWLRVQGDQP